MEAFLLMLMFVYLIGAIVAAVVAPSRGRDALGGLVLSLVISPFFTVLALMAMPAKTTG